MKQAFTLLELLVVVTIIVILIAILVPAAEQAMNAAQLTTCATRQRAAGSGIVMYMQDNQKYYPHRPAVWATDFWPMAIASGQGVLDDRPKIKKYISLNATLNCPLGAQLDIEGSKATNATFAAENMWFGWQYTRPGGVIKESGMLRQGDQWEWRDEIRNYRLKSKVIMGTRYIWNSATFMTSSHSGRTYTLVPLQDATFTFYRWDSTNTSRGFVDLNFTYSDLSSIRFDDVDWNYDERMARSPSLSRSGGWASNWEWTPRH